MSLIHYYIRNTSITFEVLKHYTSSFFIILFIFHCLKAWEWMLERHLQLLTATCYFEGSFGAFQQNNNNCKLPQMFQLPTPNSRNIGNSSSVSCSGSSHKAKVFLEQLLKTYSNRHMHSLYCYYSAVKYVFQLLLVTK